MGKGLQLSELRRYEMNVWGAKGRTWMQLAPPAANTPLEPSTTQMGPPVERFEALGWL